MKKRLGMLVLGALLIAAVGCAANNQTKLTLNQSSDVSELLASQMEELKQESKENTNTNDTETLIESKKYEENVSANSDVIDDNSGVLTGIETGENSAEDDLHYETIDIDLTVMSATMVYSEVYNMLLYPEKYVGKTVKMEGAYSYYYDDEMNCYYYGCIIKDATACCAQGLEFVPGDKYVFPDDFPNEGENVVVVGVFDTYEEGDYYYCTLRNAELL